MQKNAPTRMQLAAITVFVLSCFGLLTYLWLSFGGAIPLKPNGYRVTVPFAQSQQLANEADVRISGVTVGKVVQLSRASDGTTHAVVQLNSQYAPLHTDARAILRAKTLLGENYVQLTRGSASAPAIPDGGELGPANVAPSVTLDEIFRAFDARTRAAFQVWMQQQALGLGGRGPDINAALGNLDPFSQNLNTTLTILASQSAAVQRLVRNTGVVFDALSARDQQLRGLIQNGERTFGATAASSQALADTFRVLPSFQAGSITALRALDSFARDASPLLDQLRPVELQLAPTLQSVQALAPSLDNVVTTLGPLTQASAAGLPAFDRVLTQLTPLLGQLSPVLRNLNPVLQFVGLYQPELNAFFANSVAATQAVAPSSDTATTGVLHYLRVTNPLMGPLSLAVLSHRPGNNRTNAYTLPGTSNLLAGGLPVFDPRNCSNATPSVGGPPAALVSQTVLDQLAVLGVANAEGSGTTTLPAPACNQQANLSFNGSTTQYPHVLAASAPALLGVRRATLTTRGAALNALERR